MNIEQIYFNLVAGVRDYFGKNGFKRAVVGLSGGIDSSLTLKIAVDALKAENVTGILMPDLGLTDRKNIEHASKLAEFLKVKTYKVPINGFHTKYNELPWALNTLETERGVLANINTKARLRANILYHYANTFGALVLGTSNLSETLLGYGTKFGDLAADIEVIGDLYKTEVFELARFLHLPPEIINKKPSAELYKGQTDEKELGASYEELDKILMHRHEAETKLLARGFDPRLVRDVMHRIKSNKHKSEMPFVITKEDNDNS